jgi:hypothetical protein
VRGAAPARDTSQQPNSSTRRVEQIAHQNVPRSAISSVVSDAAVKSASALSEENNDATPDSQHDDPPHGSGSATVAVPSSGTGSSAAADVPAQHVRVEASPKDATPADPAPVNPTAIAARAAEALRNAEMHVGWRSDQLGRVDIHAELRGHEVAAALRVEDASGRQWLSAELPKLVESLSRQDLRVSSLNVADFAHHSTSSQSGSHGDTPQQQHWHQHAHTAEHTAGIPPEELVADTATPHRLSIHV